MGKKEVSGTVEYNTISKTPEGIIKVSAIWIIPDFMKLLKDMLKDNEIQQIDSPVQKQNFVFSALIDKSNLSNRRFKIYYKPPATLSLKSVELKSFTFEENEWKFEEEQSIARTEPLTPTHAIWHLLTYLDIEESKGLSFKRDNKRIICLLPNRSLRLRFKFVINSFKNITDHYNIPTNQLNDDLENLFNEGTYSDVVMKSADGEEFKVHKVLLASRSEVLKANFEHNFTESATNIVESPLDSTVLHEMLLFIYTDRAKVDEMPEKLLAAAEYYQLIRLKTLCEEALYKKLSVDNAIETLQLADLHSADNLTQSTLEFIKHDYEQLKLITKTKGWAKLNSVELLKRIYE